MTIQGVIHGRTIELETEPGLPDGQTVSVDIRPAATSTAAAEQASPWWLERLEVNPGLRRGKFAVKGTRVLVDPLVEAIEAGRSGHDLLREHPEMTQQDLDAVREYAKVPPAMRRSFGAWADEAEELDAYLDVTRKDREATARGIDH